MTSDLMGKVLLGQFRVDAFVASGGMGAVYRVWDLKRNVPLAMKVLHADLADDAAVFKRFQREATALKKLAHPAIVPFYGLYQTLDISFLLERFVDGPSLNEVLKKRKKPLPLAEAMSYIKALSAALGYAHANGIVHCDVKPGNVMLDRSGSVYLTDFGIARHAESTTTTLGVAGTAAYMAPEQIRGEAVTPATDVYALGVMLYEMLAARRPFRGDEAGTESAGALQNERIRYAHLNLPAPDPRTIVPAIPENVARVILAALSKKPSERHPSTRAFFTALCGALGMTEDQIPERVAPAEWHTSQAAVVPPAEPAPESDSKRKMLLWGGGAAALLILLFGCFFALRAIPLFGGSDGDVSTQAPAFEPTFARATLLPTQPFLPTNPPIPTPTEAKAIIGPGNVSSLTPWQTLTGPLEFFDIAFSPDGKTLASANLDGFVSLWDVKTGDEIRKFDDGKVEVLSVTFSPDGKRLASVGSDQKVRVWDVATGDELLTLSGHNGKTESVVFNKAGTLIASANDTVILWNAQTGELIKVISLNVDEVRFTPDDKYLAVYDVAHSFYITNNEPGDYIPVLRLYDAKTGKLLPENYYDIGKSYTYFETIWAFAFSKDGQQVALGGPEDSVWLGVTANQHASRELKGHTGKILHVEFSPDGRLLATSSTDFTVMLWDTSTGRLLGKLTDHRGEVRCVVFSPDGSILATASDDGRIILWRVP